MSLWSKVGWIFSFDTLGIIILIILVLYFVLTTKRKKYPFEGIGKFKPHIFAKKHKKKKKLNKHETRCRDIFEEIYKTSFKSIRPDWLKNPVTGKNLEIDGFSPHIQTPIGRGLGFEYDGAQHSKYSEHFHKSGVNEFVYQMKKDSFKDIKCKQLGIMLIRIPHFVAYQDLDRYIKQELLRNGILPSIYNTPNIHRTLT